MGHQSIELIQLTPAEVRTVVAGGVLAECRGNPCVANDLVPDVVARYAIDGYCSGKDWFRCSPRLFCDAALGFIVGSGYFKGTIAGSLEIGCGAAEAYAGRGYASRGVARMAEEAFTQGGVEEITAETSISNSASHRVLEKNGFHRIGQRDDPEDGLLIQWRRGLSGGSKR